MPRNIERTEVQRLLEEGTRLAEVLPAREYEEDHLPGAINLPLRKLESVARRLLSPGDPVVVYCWDSA
jgi:phage shock protein E